ncbi:MAG: hypothetical protein ACLPKZ_02085 [Acidimicrobiales bacterium]
MCVTRGEIAFLFFVGVCVAIHPGFVLKRNEGGMSNYGLHIKTAVPYTIALALLALYSLRAALLYSDGDTRTRRLRRLLLAYSAVVLSVMLSTYVYSLNLVLKDLHFALGTALIVLVGVGSLWMYWQWPPSMGIRVLLLFQLCGDLLALLSATGTVRALFVAEILSNVGFAALLIRTGRRIAAEDPRATSSYERSP